MITCMYGEINLQDQQGKSTSFPRRHTERIDNVSEILDVGSPVTRRRSALAPALIVPLSVNPNLWAAKKLQLEEPQSGRIQPQHPTSPQMAFTCNEYTFILSDRKCDFSQTREPDSHGGHGPENFPKPKNHCFLPHSSYLHCSLSGVVSRETVRTAQAIELSPHYWPLARNEIPYNISGSNDIVASLNAGGCHNDDISRLTWCGVNGGEIYFYWKSQPQLRVWP